MARFKLSWCAAANFGLKSEATEKSPEISVNGFSGKAVLNINPTDERGREYADYHEQDSNGEDGTKGDGDYGRNVQREFVTQSDFLYAKQEALLVSLLDKLLWKKAISFI